MPSFTSSRTEEQRARSGRDEERFFSKDGQGFVETNGTPAVANGKIYFGMRDEVYCIGKKNTTPAMQQVRGTVTLTT